MFDELKRKMDQVIALVKDDLNQIKAGRAKPSLVENIKIEAYEGQHMPLIELASITAPDPHQLLISPWDKTIIKAIESSLRTSEHNLNPTVDGEVIRIAIPPLTGERREELVKLVNQRIESGKQMMRTIRNDQKKAIDDMEGEPNVSEDDIKKFLEDMQTIADDYHTKLDDLGHNKETELREI